MEHEKLTSLNRGSPDGTLTDVGSVDAPSPHVLTSVLLDGELRGEEFARACIALGADAQARQRWHDYHLVGEALRNRMGGLCAAVASRTHDEIFLSRLHARLARETGYPRPAVSDGQGGHPPGKRMSGRRAGARDGANDPYGAWRFTAGVCALVVVSLLGWQGVTGLQSASQSRQLAQGRIDARSEARADAGRRAMQQSASQALNSASMFSSPTARTLPSFSFTEPSGSEARMVMLRDPRLDHLMARQATGGVRPGAEGRHASPRLGRAGVAAQGVLVNLDKGPALPR